MARGFAYADGASGKFGQTSRPKTRRASLVMHAQSRKALVRETIARRSDCAIGLMVTLAHGSSEDIHAAIAGNSVATRAILEHLSTDRSARIPRLGSGNAPADAHGPHSRVSHPASRAQSHTSRKGMPSWRS